MLYNYWNQKRGSRRAPERSEIDPGAIRSALGDTFILEYNLLTEHPFRLAGTRVCALFGRELRDRPLVSLWDPRMRSTVSDLAALAADEAIGIVAGAQGQTEDGQTAELEFMLLPLDHHGRSHLRLIGTLSSLSAPYWLGTRPFEQLVIGPYRHVGPQLDSVPVPVLPPPGRARFPQLVVHPGGRIG